MVCLSTRPGTERLLRVGARIAGRLATNWYAVYVTKPERQGPRRPGSLSPPRGIPAHGPRPGRNRSSTLSTAMSPTRSSASPSRKTSPTSSSASPAAHAGTFSCAAQCSTASSPKSATSPCRSSPCKSLSVATAKPTACTTQHRANPATNRQVDRGAQRRSCTSVGGFQRESFCHSPDSGRGAD